MVHSHGGNCRNYDIAMLSLYLNHGNQREDRLPVDEIYWRPIT